MILILFIVLNLLTINICKKERIVENGIINIGINDKNLKTYEDQFPLSKGMSFNSFLIIDEKILIVDGVGKKYENEWMENIQNSLEGREPDFILIQHMEPDSIESINTLVKKYSKIKIVSSKKSFNMIKKYLKNDFSQNRLEVKEGDKLELGKHILFFIEAPMVHWPEVIITYDSLTKTLFTSDSFSRFGTDEKDEPWEDEARRFYFGVLGKYGSFVQSFIQKISKFEIKNILPSHGQILNQNIAHYISFYDKWSKYTPEEDGVVIVYSTVYGHTKVAVDILIEKLKSLGVKFIVHNLSFSHVSQVVADSFKYSKLVIASVTYHDGIYPFVRIFVNNLISKNYQSRKVSIIENYSWKPNKGAVLTQKFKECKNLVLPKEIISIRSKVKDNDIEKLNKLAIELAKKN